MVKLSAPGFVHPVAASFNQPDVRFRLPDFDKLKAAYTDPDLKIPEDVIKARVIQLLQRMKREGRLKTKEDIPEVVAKIFPAKGKMDQSEFNRAIDPGDRKQVYRSISDADTKVKPVDKPRLQTAMKDAATLVQKVEGNAAGLTQVFGKQDKVAKANYVKTRNALNEGAKDMDAHVTTDYNLDDPEVGLGGFANFKSQKMHLLLKVAQVEDVKETKAVVIHEAAHLSNPTVDDQVYYEEAGFFQADEDKKVANAAHYEELPRREMGTSKFDKKTFKPNVMPGGGAATREDIVKADTALYLRKAWDAGVDAFTLVRGVRREFEAGRKKAFDDNKALLLEMSKLMGLTIHRQTPGKETVTMLDVTLAESVSRGVAMVGNLGASIPVPNPPSALTDTQLRDRMVARAVNQYGNLLKDPVRDKALLDWLVAHYRSLPGV